MIKRVKDLGPNALIASEEFRDYVEKFESEILRGISHLAILSIIKDAPTGTYGYQLLKDLEDQTNQMLVVEEGKLYPLLKSLAKKGYITGHWEKAHGRRRKIYTITEAGAQVFNHMSGFFGKLLEAIAPLVDISVGLRQDRYIYCPNCANKIELASSVNFCDICGLNIQGLKARTARERGAAPSNPNGPQDRRSRQ